MADQWTEVTMTETDMHDFESDKILTGILTEIKRNVGANDSNIYVVQTDKELTSFWGSSVLDNKLKDVFPGQEVRVTYLGKVKSEKTGREYKDFKVEYRSPEAKKVDKPEL